MSTVFFYHRLLKNKNLNILETLESKSMKWAPSWKMKMAKKIHFSRGMSIHLVWSTGLFSDPLWTLVASFITQAVRHRVLKWAPFVFRILFFGGRLPVLYADWLARRQYVINVISRRTKCGREKCVLLAKLGSMDCLLERSYHVQMHTQAAVDPY